MESTGELRGVVESFGERCSIVVVAVTCSGSGMYSGSDI